MKMKKDLLISLFILSFGISAVVSAEGPATDAAGGAATTAAAEHPAGEKPADAASSTEHHDSAAPAVTSGAEMQKPASAGTETSTAMPQEKKKRKKKWKKSKHHRSSKECVSCTPAINCAEDEQNRFRQLSGICRSPNGTECQKPSDCPAQPEEKPASGGCSTGNCPL